MIVTVAILRCGVPFRLALAVELVEAVLILVLHLMVLVGRTPLVLRAAAQLRRKDLPFLLDEVQPRLAGQWWRDGDIVEAVVQPLGKRPFTGMFRATARRTTARDNVAGGPRDELASAR